MDLPQLPQHGDPVPLDEVLGDCLYVPGSFQLLHCIVSKRIHFYFRAFKTHGFLEILQRPSKLERFPDCLDLLLSQCQSSACVELTWQVTCCSLFTPLQLYVGMKSHSMISQYMKNLEMIL